MYDVIVIGSGISGLHCAYQLRKQTTNMCILEKEKRIGGRIETKYFDGNVHVEAGARIFHHKQFYLNRLLIELGLARQKCRVSNKYLFVPQKKTYINKRYIVNPYNVLKIIVQKAFQLPKDEQDQITLYDLAKTMFNTETIKCLLDSIGDYEPFMNMNANNAAKHYGHELHDKNRFYTLEKGMFQIIERLQEETCDIPVYVGQEVENIRYISSTHPYSLKDHFEIYVKGEKRPYRAQICICAIPKIRLETISYFNPIKDWMNCVGNQSMISIYAMYNKRNIWFRYMSNMRTNNELRSITPIEPEKGIIQLGQADGEYVKYWKEFSESYPRLKCEISKKIKETFGLDTNEPKWFRMFLWEHGAAYWNPGCNSEIIGNYMLNPYGRDIPLYICGDNFSQKQGWIEGALNTSHKVVKLIRDKMKTKINTIISYKQ